MPSGELPEVYSIATPKILSVETTRLQADLKKEDVTARLTTADHLDPDPDYQTLTWALDRELEFN